MSIQNEYVDPHEQNTDTKLDEGGANEVSASEIITALKNIVLNAFRIAVNGSLVQFNMTDGIVDEYEDQSGIDTVNSTNEFYDDVNDLYKPLSSSISSPFAHFKCNDDADNTTVTDDGTGSNNGIASTNTSNLSIEGKINDAFDFDGSSEYISLNDLATDIRTNTTGTICMWIYADSAIRFLFSVSDTDAESTVYLALEASKVKGASTLGGVDQWICTTNNTLNIGTWYHIVLVQDGTEPKIYVNGSLQDITFSVSTDKTKWYNGTGGANLDNARLACINWASGGNTLFYNGRIDDFRYYANTVLTTEEIQSIYNDGYGTEDSSISEIENMTLISDTFIAESIPTTTRIVFLLEDVDSITLNTDLKGFISRDGGSTYAEVTLADDGNYDTNKRIITAITDLTQSGIGSGTNMIYKFTTHNQKDLKIHATALSWN